jgi:hypothetical protein
MSRREPAIVRRTRQFWDRLPDATKSTIADEAVWGAGWFSTCLDLNDGDPLDRRTLGQLIDHAISYQNI